MNLYKTFFVGNVRVYRHVQDHKRYNSAFVFILNLWLMF